MSLDAASIMACPVCQSADATLFAQARDFEYFTSEETYQYLECTHCGAVYLNHPPIDRLNEIYPSNYYSYVSRQEGFFESVKQWLDGRLFKKSLDQIPGDGLSVLDVGGGAGWLLSLVRKLSPRVVQTHEVDVAESVRAAAEAAGHQFHCARIEEFETTERFDLILMLNLIEHVSDPVGVLSALSRLVSDRGLILVKTPNTDTLDRRIFQHRNWGGFHCPRHWVLFTMEGFTRLAEQCGLEVVEAKYTQGGPQWASSIMSLLTNWGLIKLSKARPISVHPLTGPLAAAAAAFDFFRKPVARTAQMFFTIRRARTATIKSHPDGATLVYSGRTATDA